MEDLINRVKIKFQEFWYQLKAQSSSFLIKIKILYNKIKKVLVYMAGETRKHFPEWKKDAQEYRIEQRKRFTRYKKLLSLEWMVWKNTFKKVDATPKKLHEMLFEDKTEIGRRFEELLIVFIIGSVIVVLMDSVSEIHQKIGFILNALEWIFTIVFTIEYLLRIYSSPHPIRYITSFFGIIDLITVMPTYVAIFFTQAHTFLVLRVLRVFRVFRLLKLVKMMRAGQAIETALNASKAKIAYFLIFVLLLVTIMGSVLYIVEANKGSGFTSIPNSIYWAIITLTTVGYGDIIPVTWLGKMIAAGIMLVGYSIIAVPTGIVSAEFMKGPKSVENLSDIECLKCGKGDHETGARYCNRCGDRLGLQERAVSGPIIVPV